MAIPAGLPIVDHHCHLSPNGEGIAAVARFRRAGGTHLFLATQQYGPETPSTVEAYSEQFETTDTLARRAESETGVRIYRVVAPFPVDLVKLAERVGLGEAVRVQEGALRLAGRWAEEGRAVALGEIGRPHFPVPDDVRDACDRVFVTALEVARDVGVPAVVHSEDLDAEGYRGLAALAAQAAFPLSHLVKHYARPYRPVAERAGVTPSFVATKEAARACLDDPGPWLWETDFLDDPRRPGAVLDLETIPRRVAQLARPDDPEGERFRIGFERTVRTVYGFTPSVDDRPGP